jgi:DUF1009 family protein
MLGIIAAQGALPIMVADNNQSDQSIVACIKGLAYKEDYTQHIAKEFSVGKVSAILNFFEKHHVKKVVICGAITRPNLSDISVDTKGAILLTKILAAKFLGDDQLLRIVAQYIEDQGFEVVSPIHYTNQIPIKTKLMPSKREKDDIEIGLNAAHKLGELDIGQAVVVDNGLVIGVEAIEGTDSLIKRCKRGVLVKCLKPNQDPRLDTPVIGVETVRAVYEAGMCGIAVKGVIVIDPQAVLEESDKLGIWVVAI